MCLGFFNINVNIVLGCRGSADLWTEFESSGEGSSTKVAVYSAGYTPQVSVLPKPLDRQANYSWLFFLGI